MRSMPVSNRSIPPARGGQEPEDKGRSAKVARTPGEASHAVRMKQFVERIPLDVDFDTTKRLLMAGKQLLHLPPDLSFLRCVRKLDLSNNGLTSIDSLATMTTLTDLNLSWNSGLASLKPLSMVTTLTVLSIAHCGLQSIDGLQGSRASLKALIANDNAIQLASPYESHSPETGAQPGESATAQRFWATATRNYEALVACSALEVVVLSRNSSLLLTRAPLSVSISVEPSGNDEEENDGDAGKRPKAQRMEAGLGGALQRRAQLPGSDDRSVKDQDWSHPLSAFAKMTCLKKLSLSECDIHSLPKRWFLGHLTELRMARNALSTLQPEGVIFRSLQLLDVSRNNIDSIATLRRCRFLKHLNLRGNSCLVPTEEDTRLEAQSLGLSTNALEAHSADKEFQRKLPFRIRASLSRLFTQLEFVDGVAFHAPSAEEIAARRAQRRAELSAGRSDAKRGREKDGMVEGVLPSKAVACHSQGATVTPPRSPDEKVAAPGSASAQAPSRLVLIDEPEDAVMNPPDVIAASAAAPFVRRERKVVQPLRGMMTKTKMGECVADIIKQRSSFMSQQKW